jgi:hypothetical protein
MSLKSLKKTIVFSMVAVLCYGLLVSCENPFSSNLGKKVDIEPPTITVFSPVSGEFLRDVATFTGAATAYRELRSVEVKILNPDTTDRSKPPLIDWTTAGITLIGDNSKAKTWSYNLDTRAFFNEHKLDDGFLRIQFRARDVNLFADTVELVYIVKNNPSVVTMAVPKQENLNSKLDSTNPEENPEKVVTNTEIKGEITDKRGLKPGYPMIKIWPVDRIGGEPEGDDEDWGWVSLFLTGVDDIDKSTYVERNDVIVENNRPFAFKLSKFRRDLIVDSQNPGAPPKRQALYYKLGESYTPFDTGLYRFRIITSDTYFNSKAGEPDFMKPRDPVAGEEDPIVGYYPSFEDVSKDTWDSGRSYVIQVVSAGERPIVELDYETLGSQKNTKLAEVPNIYITGDQLSRRKIAKAAGTDFQVQILASHPGGIQKATLQYEHTGSSFRYGFLPWDDTFDPGYVTGPRSSYRPSNGYLDNTDDATKAVEGHTGWKIDGEENKGTYFRFTANSALEYSPGNKLFQTSTEPYTLKMMIYPDEEENYTEYILYLYMDGDVPNVNIRSVQGVSREPLDGGNLDTDTDGIINEDYYAVNGNIQVLVNPSDDMGILSLKWIVEEAAPNKDNINTMLGKLKKYRDNPNAENFAFYNGSANSFTNSRMSGIETNPGTNYNFKFNTWKDSGGPNAKNSNLWDTNELWLYVIAEDVMHNLGFVLQKLIVDDDGDKPLMNTGDFLSTDDGIGSLGDLYYRIASPPTPPSGNTEKKNVLAGGGIELTFIDDDGIKLADVVMILTNLNENRSVTLSYAQLQEFLGGSSATANSGRWSGIWRQDFMAGALYGKNTEGKNNKDKLPDGYYHLSIAITDNINVKVEITPNLIPGDKPEVVKETKEFYFAVQVDEPAVEVVYPTENATLNSGNVTIHGTVSSRLKIQRLDIVFEPDVISTPATTGESPAQTLTLYRNRSGAGTTASPYEYSNQVTQANLFNDTAGADGTYLYYWTRANVNFDRPGLEESTQRTFTAKAYDGLNIPGDRKRTVSVDTVPPEINLDRFNFGRTEWNTVNGKVPIEISVYDASGVRTTGTQVHLKWWVVRSNLITNPLNPTAAGDYFANRWNTPAPTGVNGAGGQFQTGLFSTKAGDELGGGRYITVFDTRGFTEGASYLIYAMAEDGVGNFSAVELITFTPGTPKTARPFTVNNTTGDTPTMDDKGATANSLSPMGGVSVRNLGADSGLTINGVASDDDGFSSAGALNGKYVKIRFPSDAWRTANPNPTGSPTIPDTSWGGWQAVPGKLKDGSVYDIEFDYPVSGGYFASDGYKFYQLQIDDEPTPGSVASGETYGTPPGKNPERVLIGTEIGLRRVQYPASGYYSFLLKNNPPQVYFAQNDPDYLHHPGYNQEWKPKAGDVANDQAKIDEFFEKVWGKNGPSRPAFRELNNYEVEGVTHTGLRNALKSSYIIEGTGVAEAHFYYGSTKMTPAIKEREQTIEQSFLTQAESDKFVMGDKISDATWNTWLAPFSSTADGLHRIGIEAVDSAGNNTRVEWSFYRDRTGPAITFSTISPTDSSKIVSGRSGTDVTIRGSFSDNISDIADSYEYRFDHQSVWTKGRLATTNDGLANDGTKNGRSAQWVITIPTDDTGFKDGNRTLSIRVADVAGNLTTINNVGFILDRNAPAVSDPDGMVVSGAGANKKLEYYERVFSAASAKENLLNPATVFTLSGLVYDKHLSSLTAVFNPGGGAKALEPETLPPIPATWTGTHPSANAKFRIRRINAATDIGTGPAQYSRVDNEIAGDVPSDTNLYVWYLDVTENDLYNILNSPPADPLAPIPPPVTDDNGQIRRQLTITAKDRAGLNSENKNWRFYLDSVKPEVEFISTQGVSYLNSLPLEGTASDVTSIKEIRYFIAKQNYANDNWYYYNGTNWTTAPVTGALPVAKANWPILYSAGNTPQPAVSWSLTNTTLAATAPNNYFATALTGGQLGQGHYRVYLYVTDFSLSATATLAGNPRDVDVEFFIDQAEPLLTWTSEKKDYYRLVDLGLTTTFRVTASDANNIGSYEGKVLNSSGVEVANTKVVFTPTGNAAERILTIRILNASDGAVSLADGRYTLSLTVKDRAGREASNSNTVDFIVDNTNPAITVEPKGIKVVDSVTTNPDAVVGRVQFRGNFSKATGKSPVSRVAFALATTTNGTTFSNPPTYADANGAAVAEATLKTNGWYFDDKVLVNKADQRLAEITEGQSNAYVILPNTRNLKGTVTLPNDSNVRYLGNDTKASDLGGLKFNGAAIPNDDTVNKLVVHFLAFDTARNPSVITEEYWIYPEGDRPVVTVINPDQNIAVSAQVLNGRIRLAGSATDDVYVKNVWFRVFLSTNSNAAPGTGATPVKLFVPKWKADWSEDTTDQGDGRSIPKAGNYTSTYTSEAGWYMASGGGRRSPSWSAYINANGELNPVAPNKTNRIYIEVMAEDSTKDESGEVSEAEIAKEGWYSKPRPVEALVVSDAPVFGEEWLLNSKKSSEAATISTAGGWSLITDANIKGRSAYAVRVDHINALDAINWTHPTLGVINLLATGGYNVTTGTTADTYAGDLNRMDTGTGTGPGIVARAVQITTGVTSPAVAYWVIVDINSAILSDQGGAWATRAENYMVTLSVTDTSKPSLSSQKIASVPIDNIAPEGYYNHTTNVVGSAPSFGGTAGDTGAISGLSRVVLWFSRKADGTNEVSIPWEELKPNGDILRPPTAFQSGTGTRPAGLPTSVTMPLEPIWQDVTSAPANPQSNWAYYNTADQKSYIWNGTAWVELDNFSSIIIDRNDPRGNQPHHGHQHRMGFGPGGTLGTNWYVILDSTLMTSGRTTAHFLVYDKAGNVSYYSQKLMILNNIPRITKITLGTDIRGDLGLQGTLGVATRNRNISVLGTTYTGANNDKSALQTIRDRFTTATEDELKDKYVGLEEEVLDTAVGIRSIAVNTTTIGDHNVVYELPFNVRNNLLTVGVEIAQDMRSKTRNYSVQYVTAATPLAGNGLSSIQAGRVYMINNPGTGFPWSYFGAPGDTYRRGFVFLATENGDSLPLSGNYGGAAVWELTLATGNRAVDRVIYPSTTVITGNNGKLAEFVYGDYAFTGATPIPDFNPTTFIGADGRPLSYLRDGAEPWTNHSLFVVRVYDANPTNPNIDDELFGDFALLAIRVNNNDKTRPFAQLYDPNPKAEEQADMADALNPQYMGDNRTRGGLWATTENQAIVKSGHLEPRTTTSLTGPQMGGAASSGQATVYRPMVTGNAYFNIDTVSGEVILRGYVEDDQRIGRVELQFGTGTAGNASAANTFNILEYNNNGTTAGRLLRAATNANTQKTTAGDRVSFTETIDLDRHRVEWAYLWNSQTMPANTIVGDVNVLVRVYPYNTVPATATALGSENRTQDAANNTTFDYYNPDFPSYSANATNFRRYNRIPMNLRPYISGIIRNKGTYSYQDERSMQGRYMLARNEEFVLAGFNLGTGAPTLALPNTNATVVTAANGSANGVLSADGQTAFALPNRNAYNYRIFRVPDGTNDTTAAETGTGIVNYTVGGNAAVNARTIPGRATPARAIQPWNTERSPGVDGSDLWDDFTAVHIWQSNNATATGNTANNGYFRSSRSAGETDDNWPIINPAMSIVPTTGVLHASHNENGSGGNEGSLRVSTNNAATVTKIITFIDPIISSDIYYSPGTTGTNLGAGRWAVTSVIGQAGNYTGWGNLGGVYIQGPNGADVNSDNLQIRTSFETGYGGYHGESNWYNAGNNNANRITDQFLNPHIITSNNLAGTGTIYEHIHVSYYDRKDGSIKYRYNRRNEAGTIPGNNGNGNNVPRAWTNLDGGYDAEDTSALTAIGAFPAVGGDHRVVNFNTRPAAANRINAGEHNAIAVTREGYPVIAYYDATNQKLKLAVSGAVNPVHANNWVTTDVLPEGNAYKPGTGQYVSIAIDNGRAAPAGGTSVVQQNRIHIAAMNTNGNLVYIRGQITAPAVGTDTAYSGTGTVLTVDTVQTVDNVGTVGRWCKISLDQFGNPWIAYQDDGKIGSTQGAKIAYRGGAFTKVLKDAYGTEITGWETMHIPVQEFRVENPSISGRENGRLGLECFPTRNTASTGTQFWDAAVGYYTTYPETRYRIAYYVR